MGDGIRGLQYMEQSVYDVTVCAQLTAMMYLVSPSGRDRNLAGFVPSVGLHKGYERTILRFPQFTKGALR